MDLTMPGLRRHGKLVLLARADSIHLLNRQHENLAIANVAGARGRQDRLHRPLDERLRHRDLQPRFCCQFHFNRHATIRVHALELAAVPVHARDRDAAHVRIEQGFEHIVQFFRPHYRNDQLHASSFCERLTLRSATSTAPSPRVYASSPCWMTSMPMPSSFSDLRSVTNMPMTLS